MTRTAGGAAPTLTRRVLNRATVARQALLERAAMPALDMVGHLVAVQAQEPDAPYLGLWTRLEGFGHDELSRLLEDRRVVRSSVLRATQHLVTADDYLWLRPLLQPVLERVQRGTLGRRNAGMDPAELASATRELLAGRTLTRPQLRDLLAERWPDRDSQALVWAAQALVPVGHPPPAGTWRRRGAIPMTGAEEWLARPLAAAPAAEVLLRRYLAAFGPASVGDAQTWSGLTRLGEVAERLRGELRSFRDEAGRELLDLPDAPLADPDVPAPVRFLPEFDNLLLGHADRTRVLSDGHRGLVVAGLAAVLVDGFVRATWTISRRQDAATLVVQALDDRLPAADRAAVADEGARLLAFAAADATRHDIQFVAATAGPSETTASPGRRRGRS